MIADQSLTSAVFNASQGRADDFDVRIVLHDAVDHRLERGGVELAFFHINAFDFVPEHFLKVLFVADQAIDVRDERLRGFDRFFARPKLRAEVEIVADDRAGFVGRFDGFGDELARVLRRARRRCRRCAASERPAP